MIDILASLSLTFLYGAATRRPSLPFSSRLLGLLQFVLETTIATMTTQGSGGVLLVIWKEGVKLINPTHRSDEVPK